jgi:hypothetical protein
MTKGFAALNSKNNISPTTVLDENQIVSARVRDIILDNTHPKWQEYGGWNGIGTIEFSLLKNKNEQSTVTALPLFPQFKNYPLINETVLVFRLPDRNLDKMSSIKRYFYLNPVNLWNHPHHNAYPDIYDSKTENTNTDYQSIEGGQVRRVKDGSTEVKLNSPEVGGTFVEKTDLHPLLPFNGDNIIEGRFGNSIRLGNTSKTKGKIKNNWSGEGNNGDPITIIRNGQDPNHGEKGWIPVTENVNKDLSSIYLTSNQKLPLIPPQENYKAFSTPPTLQRQYNKPQVILDSGRLVFNSRVDDIILTSNNNIAISSNNTIGLSTKKNVVIDSTDIKLGSRFANQPVILGQNFMDQFEQLLLTLKNLTSTLENLQDWPGGAPIPNTIVPPMATATKSVIEEILGLVTDPKSPLLSSKSKVE